MATGGTRKKKIVSDGYSNSPFAGISGQFSKVAKEIQIQEGVDLFGQPALALNNPKVVNTLESFFIEGTYDQKLYDGTTRGYNARALQEYKNDMKELFKNDVEAITEYTAMNSVNPIVTTGLAMHKLIALRNIFRQGVIQTNVAVEPRFTIKMQHRYLITPDGKELDLVLDQNKLSDAFNSINPKRVVTLEFTGNTCNTATFVPGKRLVELCGGVLGRDNLNTDTEIHAIYIEVPDEAAIKAGTLGATKIEKIKKRIQFTPQYGPNNITGFNQPLDLTKFVEGATDLFSGTLTNNEMMLISGLGIIKKVDIRIQLDPSNGLLSTCRAGWRHDETLVTIPNANPMNIPISPEEIKDIQAMYGIDQLSMYMSIINDVLGNVKDDSIRKDLYASFDNMNASERKVSWFDFEPREGYNRDHVSWRYSSFMDIFDTFVTDLLYILNDEDVTVSIFGRPDVIRKITPTDYSYQAPSSIGPVSLEYTRTIATSDNRVYNFVSSQKLGASNDLTVILNPNNTDRIIYRVYDYQFYVSNEIKNADNHVLPGVHAFERFKFLEYQPVQGKFRVFNPSGRNDDNTKYQDQLKDLRDIA